MNTVPVRWSQGGHDVGWGQRWGGVCGGGVCGGAGGAASGKKRTRGRRRRHSPAAGLKCTPGLKRPAPPTFETQLHSGTQIAGALHSGTQFAHKPHSETQTAPECRPRDENGAGGQNPGTQTALDRHENASSAAISDPRDTTAVPNSTAANHLRPRVPHASSHECVRELQQATTCVPGRDDRGHLRPGVRRQLRLIAFRSAGATNRLRPGVQGRASSQPFGRTT